MTRVMRNPLLGAIWHPLRECQRGVAKRAFAPCEFLPLRDPKPEEIVSRGLAPPLVAVCSLLVIHYPKDFPEKHVLAFMKLSHARKSRWKSFSLTDLWSVVLWSWQLPITKILEIYFMVITHIYCNCPPPK